MRTPPALTRVPATAPNLGRFDFLIAEEREPAQLSYEFFSKLIASKRVMPSRVWFDLDGTLIRSREKKDPAIEKNDPTKEAEDSFVFQGAIVGAMLAFYEAGVDTGIFSFWKEEAIRELMGDHPFLDAMVSRVEGGAPLIRGLKHINDVAMSLAQPEDGVHAVLDEMNGAVYFDTQPILTDDGYRAPKLVEPGAILFDNENSVLTLLGVATLFAQGNLQRSDELRLVREIDRSTKRRLCLDDLSKTRVPKYLSDAEKRRAVEILDRMERSSG